MIETFKNFGGKKLGGLILILIIVIAFGFGGFGGGFSSNNQNNIAKINKTNVTTQDFMNYLNESGISQQAIKENLDNNSSFPKYKLTATTDILRDIAEGNGPKDSLFALGYAGWGPGQLESEITLDSWLLCDADNDLLFSIKAHQKWTNALSKIGVTPSQLATFSGSA